MNYEDNDTLNAGQKNSEQSKNKSSKKHDAMIAKLIASGMFGSITGAGAAIAAERIAKPEVIDSENNDESAQPTIEERLSELEKQELVHQQEIEHQQHELERMRSHIHHNIHIHTTPPAPPTPPSPKPPTPIPPTPKPDFLKDHDVKITDIVSVKLENGQDAIAYIGTVDGHEAMFSADANGTVVKVAIDSDDNGLSLSDTIIDLRSENITIEKIKPYVVEKPESEDVEVVSVRRGVEMDGGIVDVAEVNMGGTPMLFIDTDRNGEVNLLAKDRDGDGNIGENERVDISERHVPMPTEDDVVGTQMASNDYNNDADVSDYEA